MVVKEKSNWVGVTDSCCMDIPLKVPKRSRTIFSKLIYIRSGLVFKRQQALSLPTHIVTETGLLSSTSLYLQNLQAMQKFTSQGLLNDNSIFILLKF